MRFCVVLCRFKVPFIHIICSVGLKQGSRAHCTDDKTERWKAVPIPQSWSDAKADTTRGLGLLHYSSFSFHLSSQQIELDKLINFKLFGDTGRRKHGDILQATVTTREYLVRARYIHR